MFYYDRKGKLVRKEDDRSLSGSENVPPDESSSVHGYVFVNNEISTLDSSILLQGEVFISNEIINTQCTEGHLGGSVQEHELRRVQDVFFRDGQGQLKTRKDYFYRDASGELRTRRDVFFKDGIGVLRKVDDHFFIDGNGVLRERTGIFYYDGFGRHPGIER